MKKQIIFNIFLILLSLFLVAGANATTLNIKASWTAPTKNADGTACTDLAKYRVYRTDVARAKVCEVNHPALECAFSVTVADDATGAINFVATALDTSGNESADSNTVGFGWNSVLIPTSPGMLKIEKLP